MDEMKVVSKFTRIVISKLMKMVIHKKAGYNVDIRVNEMEATVTDGKTHVHLDIDAGLEKEELMKILKSIGLN